MTERTVTDRLRALPDPIPPASLKGQIAATLQSKSRRRRWLPLAAVASVVVAVMVLIGIGQPGAEPDPRFALLIAESRALERLVATRPGPAAGTRRVLIDRLRGLDGDLSEALLAEADATQTLDLLERRVALLRALADVDSRSMTPGGLRPVTYTGG